MRAKDLMSADVLTVDKDERLETVLDVMVKHRVSKIVVVDDKRPVGLVTDGAIADELGALKNRRVPASHLHASSAMRRSFRTASPDTPLATLLEALREDDAGILPVVVDGALVGVVTGSDLLALVTITVPISQVMTGRLHVVSPDDRVIHARRLMLDHHVDRLPVIEGGKLVGILGELDVAVGLARFRETVSDAHQPAALQRFLVRDVYQQTVVTAEPETPVRDAVALMRANDVGSLPVVRTGHVVGIVTRSDLLRLVPAEQKN